MFPQDVRDVETYIHISIAPLKTFILHTPFAGPYFLAKPLPMEAPRLLQYIQSIENVLIVIAILLYLASLTQKNKALKWSLFLVIPMSIYGLVVFDFGTAVRYTFPLIAVFVVGIYYDYHCTTGRQITAPILLWYSSTCLS